jgi:hypothetical protein
VKGYTTRYIREDAKLRTAKREVGTIYVGTEDRFIVSLVVGYDNETIAEALPGRSTGKEKALQAAASALDLTKDEGASGTHWFVYDRLDDVEYVFEQSEFEEIAVP